MCMLYVCAGVNVCAMYEKTKFSSLFSRQQIQLWLRLFILPAYQPHLAPSASDSLLLAPSECLCLHTPRPLQDRVTGSHCFFSCVQAEASPPSSLPVSYLKTVGPTVSVFSHPSPSLAITVLWETLMASLSVGCEGRSSTGRTECWEIGLCLIPG